MRIRTVKPEFWRSEDIATLPLEHRLLFIGLWSYVDDSGIGVDKVAHICADLFAADLEADPMEVFGRVTGGLQALSDRGMIIRYSVDGRDYLYVTNWKSHQRIDKPSKQRYPGPDMAEHVKSSVLQEGSGSIPEKVAPGTGEQGNRGTEEQGSRGTESTVTLSDADAPDHEPEEFELTEEELPIDDVDTTPGYPADFTRFWEIYPRRGGKGAACTAFIKAKKRANVETIIAGAERLRDDPNLPEGKLIPMPATWLNQDRWEDDPLPSRADLSKSEQRLQQGFDLVQRVAAKGKGGLDCDPFERKEIES